MSYLGHVISNQSVSTDLKKVEVVVIWQCFSTHVSELRSFLGFGSYYHRFVDGFAKMTAPLHKLVVELAGLGGHLANAWHWHGRSSVRLALKG